MGGGTDVLSEDALLRAIFDRSVIGISVIDADRRVLAANPAVLRMFGYVEADVGSLTLDDFVHPDEATDVATRFREILAGTRDGYQVERRYLRKDGSWFWGRLSVAIQRGDRPLFINMIEDVTARREMVHALGERMKELTCLHETSRLMLDARLTAADRIPALVALLPPAMQFPDIATACIRHGDRVVATPGHAATAWELTSAFETLDGERGEITVAYHEARPDAVHGPFLREESALLASVSDMIRASLDREIVAAGMGEANERLNLALTTAGMGFWEWDLRTNRVRWSHQLAKMCGLDGEQVGDFRAFSHLVHPDDRPVLQEWLERASAEEITRGQEIRLSRGDGGWRHMVVNTGRFRGGDGKPARVIASVLDVSERRALEDSLQLEALGQVAGGVAHDFNNLLSVMMGGADVMRMDMAPDHPWRELVDDMYNAAESGAGLTRQLLSFSRKTTFQPSAVDVNALVRRLESLLARLASKRLEVQLAIGDDVGRVWADPAQLDQVLMNLVVNARDATGETAGTILITTAVASAELVARAALGDGPHVVVSVSDSGPGIPTEILSRLFEPFFTTKAEGKGTGLGLAVVSGVARQWNGAVVVDSAPGAGATFHVLFPQLAP